jgi:acetylornithine aminotransferase
VIPFDRIGGFLLEPGSSSGLVRFPPKPLIQAIAHKVKNDGGLVLVNEVTTGMGRTGRWFGYQHYDLEPDVVALGKGLGNGYPVSAAAFSAELGAKLDARPLAYAQSHQNDPLGAAVASTVVGVIREEGLVERAREIGEALLRGLEGVAGRVGGITAVRGRGLMLAVEIEDDAEATRTTRTHRALVAGGYLVARRPGLSVLRIDPPLGVEHEHVDGFLTTLEEVLSRS